MTSFNVCRKLIGAVPASITSDLTCRGSKGGISNSLFPRMKTNNVGMIQHLRPQDKIYLVSISG